MNQAMNQAMKEVMTTEQLRRSMSAKQVRAAVRDGELYRVVPGIYSREVPDDAVTLRALHDVKGLVYTGRAAMNLYLDQPVEWPVEARHPGTGRTTSRVILRSGVPEGLRTKDGLTLVSPLQAAMDADRDHAALPALSDRDLCDFLAKGYRGIGADDVLERDLSDLVFNKSRARELLAATPTGAASALEANAFEIVRDALADLPVRVLTNRFVGNYCYDLVIPEAEVAVEIDSYRFHAVGGEGTSESSFIKERWKDNEMTHLGWVLQHYTDTCVRTVPDRVAHDIRRAVLPRIRRQGVVIPHCDDDPVWTWYPALRRWAGYAAG